QGPRTARDGYDKTDRPRRGRLARAEGGAGRGAGPPAAGERRRSGGAAGPGVARERAARRPAHGGRAGGPPPPGAAPRRLLTGTDAPSSRLSRANKRARRMRPPAGPGDRSRRGALLRRPLLAAL